MLRARLSPRGIRDAGRDRVRNPPLILPRSPYAPIPGPWALERLGLLGSWALGPGPHKVIHSVQVLQHVHVHEHVFIFPASYLSLHVIEIDVARDADNSQD